MEPNAPIPQATGTPPPPAAPAGLSRRAKFIALGVVIAVVIAGVAVLLILLLHKSTKPSASPQANPSTAQANAKSYIDSTNHFSIQPPDGWTMQKGSNGVVFQGGNGSHVDIIFDKTTNTTLSSQDIAAKQLIQKQWPDYSLASEKVVQLGSGQGIVLDGGMTMTETSGDLKGLTTREKSNFLVVLKNGRSYYVHGYAPVQKWTTVQDAIEKSLLSFRALD